jgi:dihydroorotate dehydrogenase electron transfer subunit
MSAGVGPGGAAVQRSAEVIATTPEGAYLRMVLAAPEIVGTARPGQFVALAVGTPRPGTAPSAMLLRRCFSIAAADAATGRFELLVAARGPGTDWLTRRGPGEIVDVVGPLGVPFPDPAPGAGCVLVGGGYGAAPLVWWGRELLAAGHAVALVLGAATAARLAEVGAARALGLLTSVTTDDGSAGERGRVTGVLAEAMDAVRGEEAVEVYACGPMAMLRACEQVAAAEGGVAWCATEEAMACGIGVCMTCVLPVLQRDGSVRMTRTCVEGPTFPGSAIAWDLIGQVLPA